MGIGEVGENSRIVMILDLVRMKMPGDCAFVAEVRRENDGKPPVIIPAHHHNAFAIGKVVVNRNFYGFDDKDPGRQLTANVQVFKKTVAGGRKYTNIDFFKVNGTRPVFELKFMDYEDTQVLRVPIQGTGSFICFKPL